MLIFSLRPVQTGGLGSVFFFVLFCRKKEPYFDLPPLNLMLQLSIQTSRPKKLALRSVHLLLVLVCFLALWYSTRSSFCLYGQKEAFPSTRTVLGHSINYSKRFH